MQRELEGPFSVLRGRDFKLTRRTMAELRRRNVNGSVGLATKASEEESKQAKDNDEKDKDGKPKKENDKNGYSPEFWFELKYTIVRCVLLVVIFFILNHIFNTYLLDPYFNRGARFKDMQKKRKLNDIRSRVCPQGAMDCNIDLSHLNDLDF